MIPAHKMSGDYITNLISSTKQFVTQNMDAQTIQQVAQNKNTKIPNVILLKSLNDLPTMPT
jgi:hypothetical protein